MWNKWELWLIAFQSTTIFFYFLLLLFRLLLVEYIWATDSLVLDLKLLYNYIVTLHLRG